MANDRIYLVDKITGKKLCIAKLFSAAWYAEDDLETCLNDFFCEIQESFMKDAHHIELKYEEELNDSANTNASKT